LTLRCSSFTSIAVDDAEQCDDRGLVRAD
jgi:hypothetical protein